DRRFARRGRRRRTRVAGGVSGGRRWCVGRGGTGPDEDPQAGGHAAQACGQEDREEDHEVADSRVADGLSRQSRLTGAPTRTIRVGRRSEPSGRRSTISCVPSGIVIAGSGSVPRDSPSTSTSAPSSSVTISGTDGSVTVTLRTFPGSTV